jgi:hypothetical protein
LDRDPHRLAAPRRGKTAHPLGNNFVVGSYDVLFEGCDVVEDVEDVERLGIKWPGF